MKFLILQILVVVVVELNSVSCQYQQQHFAHYEIQQQHNQPLQSHPQQQQQHHDYPQPSQSSNQDFHGSFDFDKFNQQAKQLQAQLQFFNQQQQKHIHQQINSVHQENSQPQFDFAVNGNYSDLEKASEQFVNLGSKLGNHNVPAKVIKITKTVAVKQPVPVPYPVPVVKVVKEQTPAENHHQSFHHPRPTQPSHHQASSFYNFTSYSYPTPTPAGPSSAYIRQHSATPSQDEFDTEPFYITTPQKETIKIIPVPYFVDEHGNKHEVSAPQNAPSHNAPSHYTQSSLEEFYPHQQSSQTHDGSGKFQSFTFSYHPTPQHHQQLPETKYYYNHDSDNSASSDNPVDYEDNSEQQHYRYKYVSYE